MMGSSLNNYENNTLLRCCYVTISDSQSEEHMEDEWVSMELD